MSIREEMSAEHRALSHWSEAKIRAHVIRLTATAALVTSF